MIEVAFTDHKGRRVTKIDLNDKDKIKRLAAMALGSPKWKVERDQYKKQADEFQTKLAETGRHYAKLEEAFGEGGAEGIKRVVNLLARDENALDTLLDARQAERDKLSRMSDSDRVNWEREQERLKDKMEYEKRLAQLTAKERATIEREEAAQLKALEANALTAFDKYSFEGKLGDREQEKDWNEYVWEKAIDLLDQRGIKAPTQRQLDAAFRIYHDKISKAVSKTAAASTEKNLTKAKVAAESKAASVARSKMTKQTPAFAEEFRKNPAGTLSKMILGSLSN